MIQPPKYKNTHAKGYSLYHCFKWCDVDNNLNAQIQKRVETTSPFTQWSTMQLHLKNTLKK